MIIFNVFGLFPAELCHVTCTEVAVPGTAHSVQVAWHKYNVKKSKTFKLPKQLVYIVVLLGDMHPIMNLLYIPCCAPPCDVE